MPVGHPTRSSEFPHDNADIAAGAVWICAELTGPATPLLEQHEPVQSQPFVLFFDDEEAVEGPVDIHCQVAATQSEPDPPAFSQFEAALTSALMARSASRSAAIVPRLLRLESLPADCLSKDVQLTLQSRGYFDGSLRYSEKYRALCGAWGAVLRGSSDDFSACGTTTLDRFGADLLAALLAVPATRAEELRRELRKAGIAAFGVLQAA